MPRTAPVPNIPTIPGMNPGVLIKGGGGAGGGSGAGRGGGKGGRKRANGKGGKQNASADEKRGGCTEGDPVCPITGRMLFDFYDFGFGGPLPLRWVRSYSSRTSNVSGDFGYGWSHGYGWQILEKRRYLEVLDANGRVQYYDQLAPGEHGANGSGNVLARTLDDRYLLSTTDLETLTFTRVGSHEYRLTSIADLHGNQTFVQRTELGAISGLIDSAGRHYSVVNDARGRIIQISVHSSEGHQSLLVAQYQYDSDGNLTQFVDAEGYTWRYHYQGHLLVEHETASGLSYRYRYDGSTHEANCIETWGEYVGSSDPALEHPLPPRPRHAPPPPGVKGIHYRKLTYFDDFYTEVENSLGGFTRYFGDDEGRAIKIVNPLGGVTTRRFNEDNGAIEVETDEEQRPLQIDLDERGEPAGHENVRIATGIDGTEEHYDVRTGAVTREIYDGRRNLAYTQYPDGTSEEWRYDDRGQLSRHVDRNGSTWEYVHDAAGNLIETRYPTGGVERSEYDWLGRRIRHVGVDNAETLWRWDNRSEITYKRLPDGREICVQYNADRKPILYKEGNRVTTYVWGGMAWLAERIDPDGSVTKFKWDYEGNLVRIVRPSGREFVQTFDHAGFCKEVRTFEGQLIKRESDLAYNLRALENAEGKTVLNVDDVGRLDRLDLADGGSIEAEYGAGGYSRLDNGTCAVHREYDVMGRVAHEHQGQNSVSVGWRGERLGSLTSHRGLDIEYSYQSTNPAIAIKAGALRVYYASPTGSEWVTQFGDNLFLAEHYTDGQLVSQAVRFGGPTANSPGVRTLLTRVYERNDDGDITRVESEPSTTTYELDVCGRIRRRTATTSGDVSEEFIAYDADGSPRIPGVLYGNTGLPIQVHGEQLSYDKLGRLIERLSDRGKWQYEWNALDQLVRVTTPSSVVEMEYDAQNRRTARRAVKQGQVVESTSYLWTGRTLLEEYHETEGFVRTYLRAPDHFDVIGHVDTFHDGRSSNILYVNGPSGALEAAYDETGTLVFVAEHTVFGDYMVIRNDYNITSRFCNQYADDEVGLAYNLYRWYDPRTGLFVTSDPWLLEGSENPRDYAENPLRWCDPTGLMPRHPGVGTGAGNSRYHPSPPNAVTNRPAGVGGLTGPYLAGPGHWAMPGNANPPGYAACPPGALDRQDGSAFGSGQIGSPQHFVDAAGAAYGCHSCGRKNSGYGNDPKTGLQHWTCDHQPPKNLYGPGAARSTHRQSRQPGAVRLYPHCKWCARKQGGFVSNMNPAARATGSRTRAQMTTSQTTP